MTRTALLIGANHGGLKGVHRDLAVMGKLLCERRFTTRICGPEQATRSGVLAAYDQLIADARPDDAIVVYYSGHGGYTGPSGVPGDGPTELQYIVPMGFTDSDEGEFLGITSAELSVRQAQLTAITDNVTVILDCCHSGLMSRGSEGVIKSIGRVSYDRVRAHLDRLEREGLRTDLVPVGGNPHAVRIVACAPQQRAYEYEYASNAHVGVLTESLAHVLAEADTAPVTWADILDRVRNRVIGLRFSQRPEVEGPSNRLPFSTEVAELLHSLPVTVLGQPNRVGLDCAPLLQVQSGDEFMLMPAGMGKADPDRRIGDLTVDSVSALSATGQVSFAAGHAEVPLGARAFRTKVTAPRIAVRVPLDDPTTGAVLDALEKAALARPAEPDETGWTGQVQIATDGITLCDRSGPLHPPYPADPHGLDNLAHAVRVLAQATELRRLVGDPAYPLKADVTIEWGLVVDGAAHPLTVPDKPLVPGQKIYVKVHNRATTAVYVSLLDIGVSGRISLVYRYTPSGRLLAAGQSLTLGYNETSQQLTGSTLAWPEHLDQNHARPETILVVLTSEPQSLLALELPAIAQSRSTKGGYGLSRLQNMVDQLAVGGTRDVEQDWTTGVRYNLRAIDFEMAPEPTAG